MTNNSSWTCTLSPSSKEVRKDDELTLTVTLSDVDTLTDKTVKETVYGEGFKYKFSSNNLQLTELINAALQKPSSEGIEVSFSVPDIAGDYKIHVTATAKNRDVLQKYNLTPPDKIEGSTPIRVVRMPIKADVTLQKTFAGRTDAAAFEPAIRNRTAAIGFERYNNFINCVLCKGKILDNVLDHVLPPSVFEQELTKCVDVGVKPQLNIHGPYAYSVLKLATQVFLTLESGVVIRDDKAPGRPKIFDIDKERIRMNDFSLTVDGLNAELRAYLAPTDNHLPYLDRILTSLITLDGDATEVLPYCFGVLQHRLTSPSLIELIWSYWLEEGMLVQTMNAIARRFQNRRGSPNDPLGELEFDPLRPLNNLIWGFIQDEHNRLTVSRRAHEYQHHYGLSLIGTALSDVNPADSRSKFIEAFHNLLSCAARFFKEDSDTTVIADAFPLLNALKEVHLILAEGAHNQFGDLTWTARAEMLTIQWMLARPEMREFLRGRYMVPYQEEWMGAVDSMKKLQGWTDTTITHFYELAVTGERILLSVRYGDWSDIENIEDQAKNWARSWKPEIQRYIHGYRTATGVDLAADITDTRDAATRYLQPSALIQRRLTEQVPAMRLRAPSGPNLIEARVSRRAQLATPVRPRLPDYRNES
jgi:hypothetical protein